VHRDIKPDNLVADFTTPSSIKLYVIDFDIAKRYSKGDPWCTGFLGTAQWTAPEVADGVSWDPMPADIWAIAATLQHLAWVSYLGELTHG